MREPNIENIPELADATCIYEFNVLWEGWNCDNKGWVYESPNGARVIILTSHHGAYIADPKEIEDKIIEYQHLINKTVKALDLVN